MARAERSDNAEMEKAAKGLEEALRISYEVPNTVLRDIPEPMVTVRTSAYQHAAYIRQCMDGVLGQKVDFPVEYLIGEDFSTDGTREIVLDYAARYPGRIRVITADRNVGMRPNGRRTSIRARGKYVALCEGDDHWIDPHKLADQVAMLEADPNMSACVSDAWNETDGIRSTFNAELERFAAAGNGLGLRDILLENIVPTATILVRRELLNPVPVQFGRAPAGDWLWLIHMARQGRIGILNRKTAVRTRHAGGRISMKDDVTKGLFTVRCMEVIREMVPADHQVTLDARIIQLREMALDRAFQADGINAARAVWGTFHGQGLPMRKRLRWWTVLHLPALVRFYTMLRGGGHPSSH